MPWWFLIQLAIGVALMVVAYALAPKPKQAKPAASSDLEAPTAEAGRPIPVVFGSLEIKGSNVLWYGDKEKNDYKVKA